MSHLGEQIRARRKALDWTLDDLARHAGLTKSFLSDVENGKRSVSADSLLRLSNALGVSMDRLMCVAVAPTSLAALLLPLSLTNFAQDADLPFKHMACLYWLARTIAEYRGGDVERTDWLKLYEAVKEWLE